MQANKDAGLANWYHPASLTQGGQFANGSNALWARHCAFGCLGTAWAIWQGGRQADLFRMRWWDCTVPLGPEVAAADGVDPPLFVLGLGRVLQGFQQGLGTGFWRSAWHCKHGYQYSAPDGQDLLPPSMSGICFGAIYTLCFMVLQFLQVSSPAAPIVQQRKGDVEPRMSFNNPQGYVFGPYGGLAHVAAEEDQEEPSCPKGSGDGLAETINQAISSAGFIQCIWDKIRGRGEVVLSTGGVPKG
jgi:hypothetical protein